MRDTRDNARAHRLAGDFLEALHEAAAFGEQHVPLAQGDGDLGGEGAAEVLVRGEAGGGVGAAVLAGLVGGRQVGEVEEVGEVGGEDGVGVDAVACFGGAGLGPVEERVEGVDGGEAEVLGEGEGGWVGCECAGHFVEGRSVEDGGRRGVFVGGVVEGGFVFVFVGV